MSYERLSCKKRKSYGEVLGIHSPYYRTQRASTAGNFGFRTVTAHCRSVVREIVRRAKKCRKFTSIAFFLGKPHTIALIIARMAKLDVPVPVTNQHNVSGEGGQVRKFMRKYVLMALTSVRPGTEQLLCNTIRSGMVGGADKKGATLGVAGENLCKFIHGSDS